MLNQPALPLAGHELIHTADLDEARERVAEIFCPHSLETFGGGEFDARHHHLPGERLSLNYIQYGAKTAISPGCLDSFYLVQIPISRGATITNGAQRYYSHVNCAAVLNPHEPTEMLWEEDCRQVLVQIDRCALNDHLAALLGGATSSILEFQGGFDLTGGAGAAFRSLVLHLVSEADRGRPAISPTGLLARQYESALLSGLLEAHQHNYTHRLVTGRGAAAPRYVRRAEEFIVANLDCPIALEHIARAAGVSARGLQLGFRQFRNTTPMAFLRGRRLKRAHRDLLVGGAGNCVTDVATRWGFNHFGRFAKAYREAFGCAPRDTLRDAPIDRFEM